MSTEFCFVNGFRPDRKTKKLLKRHVMIGKNAGRTIHRESKVSGRKGASTSKHRQEREKNEESILAKFPLSRGVDGGFLTCYSPIPFSSQSLRVIHQYFTTVADNLFAVQIWFKGEEAKSRWLQLVLTDEISSHCALSLMETCNSFYFDGGRETAEFLFHVSRGISLVNKRLCSEEALSDSTISLITMLILQEHMRKLPHLARIHAEGLRNLVELRGGLGSLTNNRVLLLKICKIDIICCLQFGWPLKFYRSRLEVVTASLFDEGQFFDREGAELQIRHRQLNPKLQDILVDVYAFSALLNSLPPACKLSLDSLEEMMVSVFSRLLDFQPIQNSGKLPKLDAFYHIALNFFMMTLIFPRRVWVGYEFGAVSTRLTEVLREDLSDIDKDLLLWLVALCGAPMHDNVNEERVKELLREITRDLGVTSREGVKKSIDGLPWVHHLHDPPLRTLFEQEERAILVNSRLIC